MINSKLFSWNNLNNKRVFLRADLNVPLENGKIHNDFCLKNILPTLDFLLQRDASIVLATHIGRPQYNESELSTHILIPWFKNHGYTIRFIQDFMTIKSMPIVPGEILLIENLRFFPGEKKADPFFAKQLATTAQYYVNDAFGTIHEHDCSTVMLPYEFAENKRSIGFIIEKELPIFTELAHNPHHPFVAILGGKKIKDKIPLICCLLDKVDAILLCPALCFSFRKALHKPIGKSLVDDTMLALCTDILQKAECAQVPIIFPIDYQVAAHSFDGKLSIIDADEFPDDAVGISIGPRTVAHYTTSINQAKTIFLNCAMGFVQRPETQESTKKIIAAMAQSSAQTIIAGGDSIDTALSTPYYSRISHLSTGGGAAIACLSGAMLPGLLPFNEK